MLHNIRTSSLNLGATYLGNRRSRFLVWAPLAQKVEVHILGPRERIVALGRGERGYHQRVVDGVGPGALYLYRLDGQKERPDPASRFQPQGVHGPSQVIGPSTFAWEDQCWFGLPLLDFIIYELHVGTFTPEGTCEAVVPHMLDQLQGLGITAVELMPVAQFPGSRNWGYDGVYPFAVQDSYGGPEALKRLVNACHLRGLAVILDVVYNHLGPEGNYLGDFGPYFTDRYRTPWGAAINFDGPYSDEVRRFFIDNALYWLAEFHIDALRLDAIHGIRDFSAQPFLEDLAIAVGHQGDRLNRRLLLIAESDLNDARIIRPRHLGGYGLDAQWSDDFHHALHSLLTGEGKGYYLDFGKVEHLARSFREGFVYSGQYSAYRQRRHGNSSRPAEACQFVVCAQNHDQVGNRMRGDRLGHLVPFDSLKLAAGAVILSPFIPLIFMGEEYAEPAPFQYFTSHGDEAIVQAVRVGRREEFASFEWQADVPDPQEEDTFLRSKLHWEQGHQGHHKILREFYKELVRLRKEMPALARLNKEDLEVVRYERPKVLFVRRWAGEDQALLAFNFSDSQAEVSVPLSPGSWRKELDSSDARWLGNGRSLPQTISSQGDVILRLQPRTFALFSGQQQPLA